MKTLRYIIYTTALTSCAWASQAELVGKWRSKDGKETTVFTTDGRVTSLSEDIGVQGKYECKGEILSMKFEGDGAPPVVERKYKIEGDTLKMEDLATHHVTEMNRADKKKG